MKNVKVNDTHSFALVGHSGDGKTSLGEALLHAAGATPTLGRVDDGSSLLNHLPEEKERRTTITSSVFGFDLGPKHLTLIDTPGDSNFQADGQIALSALDGAVLVVSAVGGAKVGTSRMWRASQRLGVPLLAFVNGLDREHASFEAAVQSLRELELKPVVLTLPIGEESGFSGVIDLLRMKALGAGGEREVPAELAATARDARQQLVESVAECDDALLEKYLEEGALADDEILRGLVAGTRARAIVPLLCGSATAELGIGPLLWAVTEVLPSAADAREWPLAEGGGTVEPTPEAPFSALVF
jgi:elongation factor G